MSQYEDEICAEQATTTPIEADAEATGASLSRPVRTVPRDSVKGLGEDEAATGIGLAPMTHEDADRMLRDEDC